MPKGHLQNTATNKAQSIDPFGNNVAASQAYRAMERLVAGTYMVTNLVPESEYLREHIRHILNELLKDILTLRKGFTSVGAGAVKDIVAKVRLIISLLNTLYIAGMISKMNLLVLETAFARFIKMLDSMSTASSADGVELTNEYFESLPATDFVSAPVSVSSSKISSKYMKTIKSIKGNTNYTKQTTPTKSKLSQMRVNNILEFITKRGNASVGDLSAVITNCSSKTLQRDLSDLVSRNILLREGSKRWTRYSIK